MATRTHDLILPAAPEKVTEDWLDTPPKETAAAWAVRLVPRLGLSMQGQVPFQPLMGLPGKGKACFYFLGGSVHIYTCTREVVKFLSLFA
jgi:hypothetical protein